MGFTIPTPPISFKSNNDNKMEHIEQHHFVKKSEKQAVNKHQPKEEPKFDQDTSFSIGDNTFHYNEPKLPITSSYGDTSTIHSFQSVEDAIANGKDSDLVAMPVGEVRKMQERIRILQREVMKSPAGKQALTNNLIMENERMRIKAEQQRIELNYKHKQATDLRKSQIKNDIENSRDWKKIFNS
jgi:hypothetical protein